MDYDAKPSKTQEGVSSVLGVIREKLRPVFVRRFRQSHSIARKMVAAEGLTEADARLFLAGFSNGWLRGALDASAVSSQDLRQEPSQDQKPPTSVPEVH